MKVVCITRTDSNNKKRLDDFLDKISNYNFQKIFIITDAYLSYKNIKNIPIKVILNSAPTSPTSLNDALAIIENEKLNPDAFFVCSKEVKLETENIKDLIDKLGNKLVVGYKFFTKDKEINKYLKKNYNNLDLLAYHVPWNTCALWNSKLFKKYVGKFDEITNINPFPNICVCIGEKCYQTEHKGMEDGLALAKASSISKIKFKLLDKQLEWCIKDSDEKNQLKKLARKDIILKNFMAVRDYSVEDLLSAEIR